MARQCFRLWQRSGHRLYRLWWPRSSPGLHSGKNWSAGARYSVLLGRHGTLETIRGKIEHGTLAGNICTRNEPRSDTVGVDCSAFVSATWGLVIHSLTSAIPSMTQPVTDTLDLRPGDAFNNEVPCHAVLEIYAQPHGQVME